MTDQTRTKDEKNESLRSVGRNQDNLFAYQAVIYRSSILSGRNENYCFRPFLHGVLLWNYDSNFYSILGHPIFQNSVQTERDKNG